LLFVNVATAKFLVLGASTSVKSAKN